MAREQTITSDALAELLGPGSERVIEQSVVASVALLREAVPEDQGAPFAGLMFRVPVFRATEDPDRWVRATELYLGTNPRGSAYGWKIRSIDIWLKVDDDAISILEKISQAMSFDPHPSEDDGGGST